MLNCYSLDQLIHKADCEDNELALAIADCLEDEIAKAVEALEPNDADYSYGIWNAVEVIKFLTDAPDWYKVEEKKHNKDKVEYKIVSIEGDTSPTNNNVYLWKYKGTDNWTVTINTGQYGETEDSKSFIAKGFKDAQNQAVGKIIDMIQNGAELNL